MVISYTSPWIHYVASMVRRKLGGRREEGKRESKKVTHKYRIPLMEMIHVIVGARADQVSSWLLTE